MQEEVDQWIQEKSKARGREELPALLQSASHADGAAHEVIN